MRSQITLSPPYYSPNLLFSILFLFFLISCNKQDKKFTDLNTASLQDDATAAIISTNQPNVIIILGDDVGYEIPTYSGGQSYSTPNLDFMAAAGTQFSQAHASVICSPSRFMLMTGKYNFRNYFQWGELGLDQRTLANLAKNAGYTTCVSGKWQFDGGDAAIHNFGFDYYSVNQAFNSSTGSEEANDFYKNPTVYQNGKYLSNARTNGKYGPDMYRDYMFNFIDSNKSKPFFIYWSMNLVHKPFSPTPDDPEYASWDPNHRPADGDTVFFPSMVKYMDKQIGQLLTKLQQMKLDRNTLVIFTGDNGTPHDIYSRWNGKIVQGGKSKTVERGHHVPLLAYKPGTIAAGVKDTSLISFTDFMPTLSKIFKTPVPSSYGTIDGVSFYPQLLGQNNSNSRDWVFNHYQLHPDDPNWKAPTRWVQDDTYKEYDTIAGVTNVRKFYNIRLDPEEKKPIPPKNRTPHEDSTFTSFKATMSKLH